MIYRHGVKLGRQTAYLDTDGLKYNFDPQDPDHRHPEIHDGRLGKLANEWAEKEANGYICVEFLSGGPKNYAYKFQKIDDPSKSHDKKIDLLEDSNPEPSSQQIERTALPLS